MFYIDIATHKIILTKGDSAEIVVNVYDAKGNERGVFADDVLTMTIKEGVQSNLPVLTKTADNGIFTFTPADTVNLASGNYVYDVELKTFTGNVYTIIPVSTFCLKEDITK